MPAPYSNDFREKIVLASQNQEGSMNQLAKRFNVSVNFISTRLKRFRQTGQVDPKPHGGGRKPSIDAEGQNLIRKLIEDQPDLTLEEIGCEYNKHFEPVARSTIDRTLNKMKITRKKKRYLMVEKTLQKTNKNYWNIVIISLILNQKN